MQDMESQSLWAQVLGEGIMGEMEGKKLSLYPSTQTTFAEFAKEYPNGILLKKPQLGLPNSNYHDYFTDRTKLGIFGRVDKYRKLKGKEMVVGIRSGDKQLAVTAKLLKSKKTIISDHLSPAVLLTGDESGRTISAFSLEQFEQEQAKHIKLADGHLVLKNTDLTLDAQTGILLSGDGDNLKTIPFTTCYWFAWISFFPDTKLVK